MGGGDGGGGGSRASAISQKAASSWRRRGAAPRAAQFGWRAWQRQGVRPARREQIRVKRCIRLAGAAGGVTQPLERCIVARGKRLAEQGPPGGRQHSQARKVAALLARCSAMGSLAGGLRGLLNLHAVARCINDDRLVICSLHVLD